MVSAQNVINMKFWKYEPIDSTARANRNFVGPLKRKNSRTRKARNILILLSQLIPLSVWLRVHSQVLTWNVTTSGTNVCGTNLPVGVEVHYVWIEWPLNQLTHYCRANRFLCLSGGLRVHSQVLKWNATISGTNICGTNSPVRVEVNCVWIE